ncbi:SDR family oxidoreductase [Parvularcula maris]|uniref:SDR family oxidoreductase n=1 Tax=Parvularcula maris TaxID=2965077 RepID=A0A9X2LA73_9PROT|nr:SDR family oxidoreductase [Parvularcula maris]MCQ8185960.1 SDR family oxidoreductase [Parvularcula maris]
MALKTTRRSLLAGAAALPAAAAAASAASSLQGESAPDLSGTSILITGASSGFGRLGAEHYASLGAKVFATMRNMPRPEAEELRQLAADKGYDIEVIEIDVTRPRQVEKGVRKAEEMAGGAIDVLINNAGISYAGPIEMQDMKATEHTFETNVFGPHRMALAVLPGMREKGSGLIFQVTSQLGRIIVPAYGQYSPTKFALEAMGEQMAYELAPKGIEVCMIEPGGYPTEIWENSRRRTETLLERTPEELQATYAEMMGGIMEAGGASRETDPMDIPRAIAEIIAMPKGERPLRRGVHPTRIPQAAINQVCEQTQVAVLEGIGMPAIAKAVYNR